MKTFEEWLASYGPCSETDSMHPHSLAEAAYDARDAEVAALVEAGRYFRTHDVGMAIHVPTWDAHAATLAAYDKEGKP